MSHNHDEEAVLIRIYDERGVIGVCEHAALEHQDWLWGYCEPCDMETPTWDLSCAVCFEERNVGNVRVFSS